MAQTDHETALREAFDAFAIAVVAHMDADALIALAILKESVYATFVELDTERAYWKAAAEDPGIYWGDDDPPYKLYEDDD